MNRNAMLLLLTWAAGSVDAISYLGLGHVFTAMMTGNTVLLGLAIAQGQTLAAWRSIIALTGFCVGVAIGAWITQRSPTQHEWPATVTTALGLEAAILGSLAVIWFITGSPLRPDVVQVLILLSGIAMGIQSAGIQRLGVSGVATTYITGTITSFVTGLVASLRLPNAPLSPSASVGAIAVQPSPAPRQQRVSLLASVFFAYGFGALIGGLLVARLPSFANLAPFAAVSAVFGNATIRYHHR